MSSKVNVVIKNFSTVVSDAEVKESIHAFQKQVSHDFAPSWGIDAHLTFASASHEPPANAYLLYIFDNADQAGVLGYHDLGQAGQPLGKVFAKTTKDFGGKWTVTFSHELLEMLADPNINLTAFDEDAGRAYMYEVCDAVEADALGYDVDGITVSDFVLPGWFEPTHAAEGEAFAFKSKVGAPFALLEGGYIGYYDLAMGGWYQVTARKAVDARKLSPQTAGALPFDARPRVGSRRERRRTPKSQWQRSAKG